ncbi:MAG TPA: ABC transporter ATP-binding protein [Syntrophomonadaceae bacterium]|nr:ABC transporter ATP-binding protein [Syntrophomonadaceae bacterium]HOQ08597.1 ABC transporter ATP-binding protein [Syntrophomonadaceae bacterium]HPU49434.1 ABC transporter ATP-binding protein [Syntrophomonadaceae bacterium]
MDYAVQVKDLRKVYRVGEEKVVALDNISLTIEPGEICCILGTSGSGKTTLLNLLAGLEKPTRGEIYLLGKPVHKMDERQLAHFRQRYLGFIFQAYHLLPALTALENVSLPLAFRGVDRRTRQREARRILTDVGLSKHLLHRPTQMSGGQQQRVGIARAFVGNPPLVFADEPTGNLDSVTTREIMNLITGLAAKHRQTLLIVTHDQDVAAYASKIVHILDGRIERIESN